MEHNQCLALPQPIQHHSVHIVQYCPVLNFVIIFKKNYKIKITLLSLVVQSCKTFAFKSLVVHIVQ